MRALMLVFFTSSLLIGSSLAIAAPLGTHWSTLLNSLKDKGVEQIGSFNLEAFRAKAEKVPFHPLGTAPPSVMAGARGSAFYTTSNPAQIYILSSLPDSDQASLAQLEIHELMGALRVGDSDMAKSTALAILDRTTDAIERARLIKQFAAQVFGKVKKPSSMLVAGGFSVGGGGDLGLIRIKNEVFEYARRQAGADFYSSEFAKHFLAVDFEPLRKGDQIALNYIFRFPSTELLTVYVPQGSEDELVRQIAIKLLSIFPARADEPLITVSPSVCRHGETLRVPRPSDDEVANIQNQRARFLLGCKVVPQESGGTSTSGMNEKFVSPDRAGIFNYDCAIQAPGHSFHAEFSSAMGAPGVMAKSGSLLSDHDSASFTLYTDAKGKILAARLAHQTDRYQRPSENIQRAQSSTNVTVSLANPKISMTCSPRP